MNQRLAYNLLSSSAYWTVNKKLTREIGVVPVVILADLLSKEQYFFERGKLDKDGFFFNENYRIENDLNITKTVRLNAMRTLKESGLIEVVRKGPKRRNHYKIIHSNISEILSKNEKSEHDSDVRNPDVRNPDVRNPDVKSGSDVRNPDISYNKNKEDNKNKDYGSNSAALSDGRKLYSAVVDIFHAGYSKLTGQKLSFVAQGKKYGTAIKKIIKAASADNNSPDEQYTEIKKRAAVLFKLIQHEQGRNRGAGMVAATTKSFWSEQGFLPTTLLSNWNRMAMPVNSNTADKMEGGLDESQDKGGLSLSSLNSSEILTYKNLIESGYMPVEALSEIEKKRTEKKKVV